MMILRSAPASPFGRKVKIAAAVLGLTNKIEVIVADTQDVSDPIRQQNPLGKIPTLVLEDGTTLFDSRVIVEYLDHVAGGGKIIPAGAARFPILRLAALADGIAEAVLLQVYEARYRPEDKRVQTWVDLQAGKVTRGMAALEASPPELGPVLDAGVIGVACALGYQDLRQGGEWRKTHPKLVAWLDAFSARCPAFEATRFKG
ncbi:MAG: glutathione S-transferase family protein [Bosea sp. (in: a-proteobacteria)]